MCTPVAAVMGLQAAGGIMSASASVNAGASKQAYYNWLAKNDEIQAGRVLKAAEQQVTYIQDSGLQAQKELNNEVKRLEGRQSTVMAKNGIWSNSRTAQDIALDTQTQAERDATAIRYNANLRSREVRSDAAERAHALRTGAIGNRISGDMARIEGRTNAMSSLIGSATSIGNTYLNWRSVRTPNSGGYYA